MVKRVGKYEIGRTLGEGTFGKVKFAVNTETGEKVAIKILDKEKVAKQAMGEQIKKEIAVMKMVKQRHVVNLIEVLASRTRIFIVLELVTGGELFDKIVSTGRFDEPTARAYFRQLICGVEYCHRRGVCHRDLKPENLLLDEHAVLKISDFGLSALYGCEGLGSSTLLHTTCGTPNYVAPEVLADHGYDGFLADVWSCGVILYVLLAGFLPFDEPTMAALFRRIVRADYSFPAWFSPPVRCLLTSILVPSPDKRASIAKIKQSAWFAEGGGIADEASEPGPALALVAANSFEEVDDDALAEEAQPGADQAAAEAAPPHMNAFELIAMCGALDLTPRLTPRLDQGSGLVKRHTRFHSDAPADAILARLVQVLDAARVPHKVVARSFKIKVATESERGPLGCTIQVFAIAPGLHLVDWRRGQGDLMTYHKFYEAMRGQLTELIRPSAAAAANGHE